ncbi:hypothetical protein [Bradyrhizobium sp. SZCCHNRI3043]|uniref:hypothetical protein n=1 Tax=Bradyrhizobium sp. SZCCHNRI3043 TaxID=3057292 RepID=UPI0028F13892|nr:hypothetical protein [Bradyrhizobium sp. SZCCHNRI3043]
MLGRFFSWIFGILLAVGSVGTSSAAAPDSAVSKKVISCYNELAKGGAQVSIQKMRDCANVWVTPRILLRCALETDCAVYPDTIEGRTSLDVALKAENLNRASQLVLRPSDIPPIPDAKKINDCKKSSKTEDDFLRCVATTFPSPALSGLRDCFEKPHELDRATCFAKTTNNPALVPVLACIGSDKPSPQKLLNCAANADVKAKAEKIQQCIQSAQQAQTARDCLAASLTPKEVVLAQCLANNRSPSAAASCLDQLSPDMAKSRKLVGCLVENHSSPLSCGADLAGPAAQKMMCFASARSTADKLACATPLNLELPRATQISECVKRYPSATDELTSCAAPFLGGESQKLVACVRTPNSKMDGCLAALNPRLGDAKRTIDCLASSDPSRGFDCVAAQVGGDAPRIAGCIKNPDRNAAALCLLGDKPEVRVAQRVYGCIATGRDASSVILNCTDGIMDDRTRQNVACVARAGSDKGQLAGCAASAVLPPDAARMVSCASNSQGMTSFALCAAGPTINEEWRIAAECAVQTGGNPVGFAGCTAGRLTVRELTKCFTGQVGKDCFGPNNTVVISLNNAFKDLTQGPGPNNEVVKAVKAIGDLTGGPNSVINNPSQLTGSRESFVNKPFPGSSESVPNKTVRDLNPLNWKF